MQEKKLCIGTLKNCLLDQGPIFERPKVSFLPYLNVYRYNFHTVQLREVTMTASGRQYWRPSEAVGDL